VSSYPGECVYVFERGSVRLGGVRMGREDKGKVVGVNEVSGVGQWERKSAFSSYLFLFLE
jgi:hypothetical protein